MGTLFTLAQFPSGVQAQFVESFLSVVSGPQGFAGHYTTFECAVHGFGSQGQLRAIRKAKNAPQPPRPALRLPNRAAVHFDTRPGRYALPFMGSDASIVRRRLKTERRKAGGDGGWNNNRKKW